MFQQNRPELATEGGLPALSERRSDAWLVVFPLSTVSFPSNYLIPNVPRYQDMPFSL